MEDPSQARVAGPLQSYGPGFIAELARLGYTGDSANGQMLRDGSSEPLAGG